MYIIRCFLGYHAPSGNSLLESNGLQIAGEAAVTVQMIAVNSVKNLITSTVGGKTVIAGQPVGVQIQMETEDNQPVPCKAAIDGTTVRMAHNEGSKHSTELQCLTSSEGAVSSFAFESTAITKSGQAPLSDPNLHICVCRSSTQNGHPIPLKQMPVACLAQDCSRSAFQPGLTHMKEQIMLHETGKVA